MIMKLHFYKSLSIFLVCFLSGITLVAQEDSTQDGILVETTITDSQGTGIPFAQVTLGNGLLNYLSDAEGKIRFYAKPDNILLISANGYKDSSVALNEGIPEEGIVLEQGLFNAGIQNQITLPGNIQTTKRETVSAIPQISGSELESQPGLVFQNSLQGRLAGLSVRLTTSGLGNNLPDIYVRGLSRDGDNTAITIVDGVERPLYFLTAEEIESIEVLKDASAKILYGPRAANGVVVVKTKRGATNTEYIRATAEYGVAMNTRMAEYLGSAQYATLYNEARQNDGLAPFYSQTDIQGYENSSGVNDLRYPNADYNDYFIDEMNPFRKASFLYSGGSEGARYSIITGYVGGDGIEKIGNPVKQDRFNVRGNLDIDISPSLTAHIDGNGIIESRNWGKLNQDAFFSRINSHRPNEYPFVIDDPNFLVDDTPLGEDVIPPLGGSFQNSGSLYGDLVYGGFQQYQYFYGQTNFGLDLDLSSVAKGLKATTNLYFDNYQFQASDQISNPIRYAQEILTDSNGQDSLGYIQLNNRQISSNVSERSNDIERNFGWTANVEYETQLNEQNVFKFTLGNFYYINDLRGRTQKIENTNTFLKANYAFNDKVFVEWTQSVMGSNRFAKGERYKYFSSIGAAWVLIDNGLSDAGLFDYLKIKSSYGLLGYDRATDFYLYDTRYSNNGNQSFGERNQGGAGRTGFNNFGNPDLRWETSYEFNVGAEGWLVDRSLKFEVNYFNTLRDDIIYNNPASVFSDISGGFNPPQNLGRVSNQGIDGSITYLGKSGDFKYDLGANFLIVKNKLKENNTINNPNAYLDPRGYSTDAIFGYVAEGLFRSQDEVEAHPFQTLGDYGVGNIKYKDLDGDGVITDQDRTVVGNSFPRASIGFQAYLQYKRWAVSLLTTTELGVDFVKNNAFYRNAGEGKYSTLALDRFHPVNNPSGDQPALTTTNAANDFRTSSFWVDSASFLRLKNAEISYTIKGDTYFAKMLRLHIRGTNLFIISDEKDLDPEVPNSGVNNYPLFRTITGGVTVGF